MPRIVVSQALIGATGSRLEPAGDVIVVSPLGPPPRGRLLEAAEGADALVTMLTDRVDGELLDRCPDVRVVSQMAVGVDNVDVPELTQRGVPLGHTPGVLTDATADLAFALILAVARKVAESRDDLLAGKWTTWSPTGWLGLELGDATLGIVGAGAIGQAVVRRAQGFGMRILATSRTERPIDGVTFVPLEKLLAESDVVSVHVALTEETRHLIGATELAAMRPGAILVNTSRGPVVDQGALYAALRSGHLGGAGLDVFATEPVPLDEPLLGLPNVVAVPHIGSATTTTRTAMASLAVDNALAGLAGERLPRCANPEVYERRGYR